MIEYWIGPSCRCVFPELAMSFLYSDVRFDILYHSPCGSWLDGNGYIRGLQWLPTVFDTYQMSIARMKWRGRSVNIQRSACRR